MSPSDKKAFHLTPQTIETVQEIVKVAMDDIWDRDFKDHTLEASDNDARPSYETYQRLNRGSVRLHRLMIKSPSEYRRWADSVRQMELP